MLLEFKTDDWFPDDGGMTDESGKSMISINIIFHRELGNMVNTYFQASQDSTYH